jgi:transcriptional regulator GlxA family with amidase domain
LLVTTTDLPFGQITHMCGFREQASFTRAARRWWGASPRQLRSRQRAGAGARYRS